MTEAASVRGDIAKDKPISSEEKTKRSPWVHKIHD